MSKKQLLIITLAIFLFFNLQYLPVWFSSGNYIGELQASALIAIFFSILVLTVYACVRLLIDIVCWLLIRSGKIQLRFYALYCLYILFIAVLSMYVGMSFFSDPCLKIAARHAKKLIADVERYKQQHGQYPEQVDVEKYSTGVLGIDNYRYRSDDTSYDIYFLQSDMILLSTRLVSYDRFDTVKKDTARYTYLGKGYKYWYYFYKS